MHALVTVTIPCYLCKHRVLVNRSVLYSSVTLPDDLLVLLEPPIEQEHLIHRITAADWTVIMRLTTCSKLEREKRKMSHQNSFTAARTYLKRKGISRRVSVKIC